MNGYHDRIAWIDLGAGKIEIRPIDEGFAEAFIGGGNIGAAILAGMVGPDTDPLGPENPLIFMTGPFTATTVPQGSRHEVISLSPLTGVYGESNCGGSFGLQLKRSGHDGLVITGASENPVVIIVGSEGVRLSDASGLWGLDYYQSDDLLKEELGKGIVTAMIGPAGENMVPVACICHDGRHTRVAGRTGMGAVMGSKKLKGIAVLGGRGLDTPLADPEGLKKSTRAGTKGLQERLGPWAETGTPNAVQFFDRVGNLPISNWRGARAPEIAEKTTGAAIYGTIQVKRTGCKRCPVVCGRTVEVEDGPYATDGVIEGPEYETLALFGTNQMVDDVKAITKANEMCNRLGLDTISTGSIIAFANECYEKGVLTADDTGGLELGFGKPDVTIELIKLIAAADDKLGRALGRGVRRASEEFGGGSDQFAVQVKGLELPAHDPRFSWGQALSYATGNRGACHLTSLAGSYETGEDPVPELGYDEPHHGQSAGGKAEFTIKLQNLMNVLDSLVVCKFSMFRCGATVSQFLEWYNLVTGRGIDLDEFMEIGERGFTLKRMINNRRGITSKDDVLPPRMLTLDKVGEGVDLKVPDMKTMIADYYRRREWDTDGRPGSKSIRRLGLERWEQSAGV